MADKKKPSDTSNKDVAQASTGADSGRVAENSVDDEFFNGDKSMEDLRDEDAAASPIDAEDAAELEKVMKPGSSRSRHPIMAGMVILASLAMLWLMEEDIRYFFQRGEPTKLGDAAGAVKEGRLKDNTYVEIKTTPDINTWATVSRRGCSLGGKTSPKSYYTFYTVRDTDDKLIVRRSMNWKQRTEQQKRKTIRLNVSGRLRLFSKQGEYYTKYRRFLAKIAKKNPALQNRHEVSAVELRKYIGKNKAVLTDTEGRKVRMEAQTELALYASFDDELEVSVMRGHKVKADKVTFKGQDGPPRCGPMVPKRGARVVLYKDSETLDFGKLKEGITVTPKGVSSKGSPPRPSKEAVVSKKDADSKKENSKSNDRTKDLWLKVPLSTKAYDAKTGDPIPFKEGQLLVADGGECGGKKGQTRTINLEALPLNSRKHAELYVSRFGLPYKLIDENGIAFEFILKAPKKRGQKLLKEQRRGDPFTIDFRTEWYLCRWNEVKLQEDHLIISPLRPTHPVG